jgi:hypothetical protein
MKRQEWRWYKKRWRKTKCFGRCDGFVSYDKLSNTAVDVQLKITEDMLFEFNLDMFRHWRLYPVLVVEGFGIRGFCYLIGVASDEWLDECFGHDNADFEHYT